MQKEAKNKIIGAADAQNKTEQPLQEFHFAGGGEYEPITVQAKTPEEAQEIWKRERKKVEPSQKINE